MLDVGFVSLYILRSWPRVFCFTLKALETRCWVHGSFRIERLVSSDFLKFVGNFWARPHMVDIEVICPGATIYIRFCKSSCKSVHSYLAEQALVTYLQSLLVKVQGIFIVPKQGKWVCSQIYSHTIHRYTTTDNKSWAG